MTEVIHMNSQIVVSVLYKGQLLYFNEAEMHAIIENSATWIQKQKMAQAFRDEVKQYQEDLSKQFSTNAFGVKLGLMLKAHSAKRKKFSENEFLELLENFDGQINGRRSTQMGYTLTNMAADASLNLSDNAKSAIMSFLKNFPQLLKIPPKKAP